MKSTWLEIFCFWFCCVMVVIGALVLVFDCPPISPIEAAIFAYLVFGKRCKS